MERKRNHAHGHQLHHKGNTTAGDGGGILTHGALTVTNSTISGNTASGGCCGNRGGGIFSQTSGSEKNTITNSTISGNTAQNGGGGVYNNSGLTVIEFSTITNNTAPNGQGRGVASDGTSTEVLSSIISANTNTDVDFVNDTTNTFVSRGYNLIGDGNATGAFNQTGDQINVTNPGLGALSNNGGPTQTHALLSGSPAIDAIPQGTNGCGTTFTEDQRGVSRPQGSACDIGAFEQDQPSVKIDQASGQADPTTDSPIHFTAVFNEPVSGFTDSDVTLSGTAGATTAVVTEIAPNDGTTYDVAVSGMTTDGTVIASIAAGVAQDADQNGNTASSSTDNTVTFDAPNIAPTVDVAAGGSCGSASDMRGTINLALSDSDDPPQSLTLRATSSNRSVLPNSNISFGGGTDASRTMTVSSLTGSGTSNVTITVSDGDLNGTVLVRVISGSASNNTLSGSDNAEMIFARKGSDTVSAQGANDLMCAGNGNDRLTGGPGADHFGGGSGTDTATDFTAGEDTMSGIP